LYYFVSDRKFKIKLCNADDNAFEPN